MTIDWTRPLQTRNGKYKVRVLCTDAKGRLPVVCLVLRDNEDRIQTYTLEGRVITDVDCDNDAVNVPEKRTIKGWVNVYNDHSGPIHDSEVVANSVSHEGRIACVYVFGEYEV